MDNNYQSEFISKEESMILQGVAILLMVIHHLFGFPDRVAVPYKMIFDFSFFHMETMLSYFGKICVSMFAFISGYGLCRKYDMEQKQNKMSLILCYRNIVRSLINFYFRYWLVFLCFTTIGFIMKIYDFDIFVYLKSFLGMSDYYNQEWWYVGYYIRFLILFPMFYWFERKFADKLKKYQRGIIYSIIGIMLTVCIYKFPNFSYISTFLCFMIGIIIERLKIFDVMYEKITVCGINQYSISILILGAVLGIKMKIVTIATYDYIFVSFLIFALGIIVKGKFVRNGIKNVLIFFGKYSIYIWLTHTFFAYYYFQSIVYKPYYSIIIFIWCVILSSATGIILEKINDCIRLCIKMK